ncbi:hypothetical protein LZ30DRAFT_242961 [Colletotrichum cereale]|nr:hypothetical protein LZ30DRAFT_242961 [Colletotrichum cereale]
MQVLGPLGKSPRDAMEDVTVMRFPPLPASDVMTPGAAHLSVLSVFTVLQTTDICFYTDSVYMVYLPHAGAFVVISKSPGQSDKDTRHAHTHKGHSSPRKQLGRTETRVHCQSPSIRSSSQHTTSASPKAQPKIDTYTYLGYFPSADGIPLPHYRASRTTDPSNLKKWYVLFLLLHSASSQPSQCPPHYLIHKAHQRPLFLSCVASPWFRLQHT